MKRAGLAVVAALSLAAACTEAGRSVVLVDVTAGTGLGSVQRVLVHVTQGGASLNHIETTDSLPLKLGVYLPKSVSGMADVEACAFNDINELVGGTDQPVPITVVPGATIGPEFAVLRPGASPQVCRGSTSGRGGAGGAGGGSGAGGSGGAGGGASGSGGSAGGAGAGGSGGSIGGAGGRGGTGGTTGAGGTGGTGGRGGAGGSAAGSGGAGGGGGRGGGAGTGAGGVAGTGTGGAAGWRGAVAVANSTATERLPSVAVDFNGNAVVVFEHDGDIWFNRYSASGNSWSGASMIITGGTYAQPSVAVDGTARFTVVWTAAIGAPTTGVWYATSTDTGNTWVVGTQALATTNTYPPVLSVNSNGLAVVAWSERIGGTNNSQQAVARIRDATGGWLPAQVMHTGDDANNRYPAAAMSDVGDAFVVWEQVYNGVNSVWVRRYTSGAWTPETQLETFDAGPSYAPAIATNVHGVAIVTYLQLPTPTSTNPVKLLSQRYAGGGFVAPVEIRSAPLIASTNPPSVHLDDNGLATIVWASAGAQGLYSVEAARMTATDTAPSQVLTEATPNYAGTDNTGGTQAPMPVVRGDGKGNVVFVWRKRGLATASRFDLYARQYTTSAGWLGEALIETLDGANNVFNPAVAVNGSNEIVATWYYGGTGAALDVYANIWR